MRLHKIKINNFRKLKNCTINFRDSTFLIGSNNAGKSSVFSAIKYLHSNKNVDREDFSKAYNKIDDSYEYDKQIEMIAEYHNLPLESKTWRGFKGRVINIDKPLSNETCYTIRYKKIWQIDQTRPKVYMLEYPRVPKDDFLGCVNVCELIGETFSEETIKAHFGPSNLDKKLSSKPMQLKLNDFDDYWEVQEEKEPTWVENPGGFPGNVLSKLPSVVVIPAESCMDVLTSSNGALHKLLGTLFDEVRGSSDSYTQAQKYLNELADELDPTDKDTDFGKLIEELNGMVHNLFPESSVHVGASLEQPEKLLSLNFLLS